MFRRQIRKTLAQDVPPVLQEANFAFDKGEYGRAAELFENLARTADARGRPRASIFQLQAGRARVLAGQVKLGMPSLRRGLELLARRRQRNRLHVSGRRIISLLRERGLDAEAEEIESWIGSLAPSMPPFDEAHAAPPRKPALPTHCSACGGAVRLDEVEWLDQATAECAYCGSPIRDED